MPPPVVGEACLTAPPPASKYATCSMLKCKSSLSLHFCSSFFPSLSVPFSFSLPPYFVWFLFICQKQIPYVSLVLCVSSSKKHEVCFISLKFWGRSSLNLMYFNGTPKHVPVMGILFLQCMQWDIIYWISMYIFSSPFNVFSGYLFVGKQMKIGSSMYRTPSWRSVKESREFSISS